MKNIRDERLKSALAWCKKNNIKRTEQLSLFAKLKKKKKKLDKKRRGDCLKKDFLNCRNGF